MVAWRAMLFLEGSLHVVPLASRCFWKPSSRNRWAGLACKELGSLPPLGVFPG